MSDSGASGATTARRASTSSPITRTLSATSTKSCLRFAVPRASGRPAEEYGHGSLTRDLTAHEHEPDVFVDMQRFPLPGLRTATRGVRDQIEVAERSRLDAGRGARDCPRLARLAHRSSRMLSRCRGRGLRRWPSTRATLAESLGEDLVGLALDHLLLEAEGGLERLDQRESAALGDLDLIAHAARRGPQLRQREAFRVDEHVELVLVGGEVAHQRAVAVLLGRQAAPEARGVGEAQAVGLVEVADRVLVVGEGVDDLPGRGRAGRAPLVLICASWLPGASSS